MESHVGDKMMEVNYLPDRYLPQRPQETLEVIARISSDSIAFSNNDNHHVVVATCCDPRVADVVKELPAVFIRTPGVEVDPRWVGFQLLMAQMPRAVGFLCHDDCRAHEGSLPEAQRSAQWARHAFNHSCGRDIAFLSGKVDVESRRVSFLRDGGEAWSPDELIVSIPHRSREAVRRLLSVNDDRNLVAGRRNTTILHSPVGVLAISVGGTLSDMRQKDLAYVIDHLGQSRAVFARQVEVIGRIIIENTRQTGDRPHLLVVGTAEQTDLNRDVLEQTTTALRRLGGSHTFTVELAVRRRSGEFESILSQDEIGSNIR